VSAATARLLAKHVDDLLKAAPPGTTLPEHLEWVTDSASRICVVVGAQALASAGLEGELWEARLRRVLTIAAAWHDLGKANDHFQAMILRASGNKPLGLKIDNKPQALRHEVVSALLITSQDTPLRAALWEPLVERDPLVAWCALAAVCGHHVKFPEGEELLVSGAYAQTLSVELEHPDFIAAVAQAARVCGVQPPSLAGRWTRACAPGQGQPSALEGELRALRDDLDTRLKALFRGDRDARRFGALCKALVIGADVAGSALPFRGEDGSWVNEVLGETLTAADVEGVVAARLGDNKPLEFQERLRVGEGSLTLLRAGCGSGKTLGAYMWAARWAVGRKLFFCYPTTGTATEGFLDYMVSSGVESALLHSRARADVADVLVNDPRGAVASQRRHAAVRSLIGWGAKVSVCTVDTVAGLMAMNRTGLFMSPAIAQGAFVFDEIHDYDAQLFGLVLRFIDLFPHVPVLMMTASLTPARLAELERRFPQLVKLEGPPDLEEFKRYRFVSQLQEEVPWERVEEVMARGGKVLCVSNTVNRAMARAEEARRRFGRGPVKVYHSRFRYEDRVRHHEGVIAAFRADGASFVSTTQVAEMSLDLDADLLITDLAPIPALIQRLGRLNRRAEAATPAREAYCVRFKGHPYTAAGALEAAEQFWARAAGQDRSQRELRELFEALAPSEEVAAQVASQLLDGRAYAEPGKTRLEGATLSVILARDEARVAARREDAILCAVPIPIYKLKGKWASWKRLHGYLPVAPAGVVAYDAELGATVR
jgi:CRISPR-associated endonuclease/helicase Cas3